MPCIRVARAIRFDPQQVAGWLLQSAPDYQIREQATTSGTKLGYVPQVIAADRQLPLHVEDLLDAKARMRFWRKFQVRLTAW